MSSKRTVGSYKGHRYTFQPMCEVMPHLHTRTSMWFAWLPDESDILVCGAETLRQLKKWIDEECEKHESQQARSS